MLWGCYPSQSMTKKKQRSFKKGDGIPLKRNNDDMIEDLGCTYAQAMNFLRKTWIKLKISKAKGDEIGLDESYTEINRIQRALGLVETDFEAYEGPVEE